MCAAGTFGTFSTRRNNNAHGRFWGQWQRLFSNIAWAFLEFGCCMFFSGGARHNSLLNNRPSMARFLVCRCCIIVPRAGDWHMEQPEPNDEIEIFSIGCFNRQKLETSGLFCSCFRRAHTTVINNAHRPYSKKTYIEHTQIERYIHTHKENRMQIDQDHIKPTVVHEMATPMDRLQKTAARLRAIADARPQKRAATDPIDSDAEDSALVARCRAAVPQTALAWRSKVDQLLGSLFERFSADFGDDTQEALRDCASKMLTVLDIFDIKVYNVQVVPEGIHAIPCVEDDTFVRADCGLGRWRFIVCLSDDEGCTALIERIVDKLTGASMPVHCDIMSTHQSDRCRLLMDFMRIREPVSIHQFLSDRFAWANNIVDRLHACGWSTSDKLFACSHSLERPLQRDALECVGPSGEVLAVAICRDTVAVFPAHESMALASLACDPVLSHKCAPRERPPSARFRASRWGDREWLVDAGYVSPWLSTVGPDTRRTPVAVLGAYGEDLVDDHQLAARINVVGVIASGSYGVPADAGETASAGHTHVANSNGCRDCISPFGESPTKEPKTHVDETRCVANTAMCNVIQARADDRVGDHIDDDSNASGDAADDHEGDLDSDHKGAQCVNAAWRNGSDCGRMLNARLQSQHGPWPLLDSFSTLSAVDGTIDPSRGLLVNWLVMCDMLPVADEPFGHSVRARGLPFVRCRAHLLVAPDCVYQSKDALPTADARASVSMHAYVVATLHNADVREASIYARRLLGEPGPDETVRVDALLADLAQDEKPTALSVHPILAYYPKIHAKVCGGVSLIYDKAVPADAVTVLYESVRTVKPTTAIAFDETMTWLLDEFAQCAACFMNPPQQ
nr:hypothetical protein [Pandoravirus massiliensis]